MTDAGRPPPPPPAVTAQETGAPGTPPAVCSAGVLSSETVLVIGEKDTVPTTLQYHQNPNSLTDPDLPFQVENDTMANVRAFCTNREQFIKHYPDVIESLRASSQYALVPNSSTRQKIGCSFTKSEIDPLVNIVQAPKLQAHKTI